MGHSVYNNHPSLLSWNKDKQVPLVFVLMSRRRAIDYRAFFKALRSLAPINGRALCLHSTLSVTDKLATMVYNCLHGKAPSYLTDCCTPISDVASRRHLRSVSRRQLLVPRHNLSALWSCGFCCSGSGCLELPYRRTA